MGNGTPQSQYENLLKLIDEVKRLKLKAEFDTSMLVEGDYYRINGTKTVLCWENGEWMKPEKDRQKRYGSWVSKLEKQPIVKSAEKVSVNELYA